MKGFKKKIRAFTLSEMLVVLLLTVVVVGLAFAILNLVQQQMSTAKDNFEQGTEWNQLKQALWLDFRTYPDIVLQNQNLILKNELNQVNYQFMEKYVIRSTDTFYIGISSRQLYLRGLPVQSGPMDALQLNTSKEAGSKRIFVYRKNAANKYLND